MLIVINAHVLKHIWNMCNAFQFVKHVCSLCMYVENAMAFVCLIATNVFCGNNIDLMIGKFLSCRRILITLQSLCNGHYVNRCSDIIEANKMKQILKLADNVIIRENSL